MKQTIVINELPPSLNGSKGLKNMHYHAYSKEKERWVWLVREQNPKKHLGQVKVTYTRQSVRLMDLDNVGASFKFIGDALEKIGVILDDSPRCLTELNLRSKKAKTRKEQCIIIEVEDVQ